LALSCFSLTTVQTFRSVLTLRSLRPRGPRRVLAFRSYRLPCGRCRFRTASLVVAFVQRTSSVPIPHFEVRYRLRLALRPFLLRFVPRFRVSEFQDSSWERARFLGAVFNRLPSSHLSWLFGPPGIDSADLGRDFASHSPLALTEPRGPMLEPQGIYQSSPRQKRMHAIATACPLLLPRPPGLSTLVLPPVLRITAPAGSLLHLEVRSALPPRHPLLCAGSRSPMPPFLPARFRPKLSGHW